MGVQVALARIGSQAGYAVAIPLARAFGISTPVLLGLVLLLGGMIAFFIFAVMDKKLDKQLLPLLPVRKMRKRSSLLRM